MTIDDLDALVGVVAGECEAGEVRRRRPRGPDAGASQGAHIRTFLGCMEETWSGLAPPRPSRRSPVGRPRWQPAACRGSVRGARARRRSPLGAHGRPGLGLRAGRRDGGGVRPSTRRRGGVWMSWRTRTWRNPLQPGPGRPTMIARHRSLPGGSKRILEHPYGDVPAIGHSPVDGSVFGMSASQEGGDRWINELPPIQQTPPRPFRASPMRRLRPFLLSPSPGRLAGAVRRDVRGRRAGAVPRLLGRTTSVVSASG